MAKCIADSTLGTEPDTYLYSLAQTGNTFATVGSDDSLRLFDISLRPIKNVISAHSGISCLAAFGSEGIATAGRDGMVRIWDARAERSGLEATEPRGNAFSALISRDHFVAAGTESTKEGLGDVSVLLYDMRNPSVPIRSYVESHTDTITQLAFHPARSDVLLSGSTDGLVSIFDLSQSEEEDALQQVLNPRAAVHCTGFLSTNEVYVVTTDEHFSIHSLAEDSEDNSSSVLDFGDVREKLDCMYVVNITNASSHPIMTYGHNVNKTLSIVSLGVAGSYAFGTAINLPSAHGEEVVRDVLFIDQEKRMMSCGEDGHVKVWDLFGALHSGEDAMEVDR